MFCAQCGQQLIETARFCSRCGAAVAPTATFEGPPPSVGAMSRTSDPSATEISAGGRPANHLMFLFFVGFSAMLGMFRWGLTEATLGKGQLVDGRVMIVPDVLVLVAMGWLLGWIRPWWVGVVAGGLAIVLPQQLPVIALVFMAALWVTWLRHGSRHPNGAQLGMFVAASTGGLFVPWILNAVTTGIFRMMFDIVGARWMAYVASAVDDGGAVLASLPLVLVWQYARQPLLIVRRPLRS